MKHRYSPSGRILPDWMIAKPTAKTPTKIEVEGNLAERITLKIKSRRLSQCRTAASYEASVGAALTFGSFPKPPKLSRRGCGVSRGSSPLKTSFGSREDPLRRSVIRSEHLIYSSRRARAGSTEAARRAGINAATHAIASKVPIATPSAPALTVFIS